MNKQELKKIRNRHNTWAAKQEKKNVSWLINWKPKTPTEQMASDIAYLLNEIRRLKRQERQREASND
jgi:hypothetical protein